MTGELNYIDSPETVGELIDILGEFPREMKVVATGWDGQSKESYTTFLDVMRRPGVDNSDFFPEVIFHGDKREPNCEVLVIA